MEGKKNTSAGYLLCLALLLFAAFIVIATGTAFGRFRTDVDKDITFEIREPLGIEVVTVTDDGSGNESFDPDGTHEFVVAEDNKTASLEIAVSNGTFSETPGESDYSAYDQKIFIRVIGGNELTVGEKPAELTLFIGDEKFTATAERTAENTLLYYENGSCWIYTFEENGRELFRILEGGKFSRIKLKLVIDLSGTGDEHKAFLIEPQFITEKAD